MRIWKVKENKKINKKHHNIRKVLIEKVSLLSTETTMKKMKRKNNHSKKMMSMMMKMRIMKQLFAK